MVNSRNTRVRRWETQDEKTVAVATPKKEEKREGEETEGDNEKQQEEAEEKQEGEETEGDAEK